MMKGFIVERENENFLVTNEIFATSTIEVAVTMVENLSLTDDPEADACFLAIIKNLSYDNAVQVRDEWYYISEDITEEPDFQKELRRLLRTNTIEFLIEEIPNMKYQEVYDMLYKEEE